MPLCIRWTVIKILTCFRTYPCSFIHSVCVIWRGLVCFLSPHCKWSGFVFCAWWCMCRFIRKNDVGWSIIEGISLQGQSNSLKLAALLCRCSASRPKCTMCLCSCWFIVNVTLIKHFYPLRTVQDKPKYNVHLILVNAKHLHFRVLNLKCSKQSKLNIVISCKLLLCCPTQVLARKPKFHIGFIFE